LITLDLAAAELPPKSATAPYIGEVTLDNAEGAAARAGTTAHNEPSVAASTTMTMSFLIVMPFQGVGIAAASGV